MGAEPKPWLDKWRVKWGPLAERKTKIANEIGTDFHKCVENWLDTGDYSPATVRVGGMMRSFVSWAQKVDGTIENTELKVISKTHTYAGTLDAVGCIDGKDVVIDWKTSSRIYPEMALQLAAYSNAYKEQTGKDIKQGLIVHVSKDKPNYKLTTKSFKLGKRVFNRFLKLRAMFDDMKTPDFEDGALNA